MGPIGTKEPVVHGTMGMGPGSTEAEPETGTGKGGPRTGTRDRGSGTGTTDQELGSGSRYYM